MGVEVESNLILVGRPVFRLAEGGEIRLGERVRLLSRRGSNPLQLRSPCALTLLAPNARITIGDDSALSGVVICATISVEIGRHVLVGANCTIVDTDFHPISPIQRREHPTRGAVSRPVRIGDDVYIGTQAILLKGTTLGDGCVVGAGAVVSGVFPANSMIAGNPARIVRQIDLETTFP